MEQFASGWKRNYYGKGDVIAYRLNRDGVTPSEQSPVFGANVKMLIYGDAFWPTYTTGDNTGLIATDSMKNFIQRETLNYAGPDLEEYCRFLGAKFLELIRRWRARRCRAAEMPYAALQPRSPAFAPAGPECCTARVELNRGGIGGDRVWHSRIPPAAPGRQCLSRICARRIHHAAGHQNRPLHMGLDLEWTYTIADAAAFSAGKIPAAVRAMVRQVFEGFESGSIQEVIYQIGTKMLAEIPAIAEIHLEGENRTWDTVAERGEELGIYTEARPPYGCLAALAPIGCEDRSDGSLVHARSRHGPRHPRERC